MSDYHQRTEDLARAAYCNYLEGTSRSREESAAEFDAFLAEIRADQIEKDAEIVDGTGPNSIAAFIAKRIRAQLPPRPPAPELFPGVQERLDALTIRKDTP